MSIKEDSDRHNLYLQKLSAGLYKSKLYPSLMAARKAVRLMLLDQEELTSISQVKALNAAIRREVNQIYGDGLDAATQELNEIALYESDWQVEAISAYSDKKLRKASSEAIQSYIDKSIMSLTSGQRVYSGVWADFVRGNKASVAGHYNSVVVRGYQNGITVNQIATQLKRDTEGLLANQAETLARTGLNHYANGARDVMAQANSDIIQYRVFSATFDNRTTLICRSLGGKSWPISDDKYPRLPLHWGERSSYYFVTDEDEIGEGKKVAIGGKTVDDINPRRRLKYRGKRDTDIFNPGTINADVTQDEWLRKQPRWFIESALDGKARASLFIDGGLKIDKFVDMQGRPITLSRLKELDSNAFKRAGL